jgi:hypothetical protein
LATTANTATTNVIDRTKFDIKYGSGSFLYGDKAINDDFTLAVALKF